MRIKHTRGGPGRPLKASPQGEAADCRPHMCGPRRRGTHHAIEQVEGGGLASRPPRSCRSSPMGSSSSGLDRAQESWERGCASLEGGAAGPAAHDGRARGRGKLERGRMMAAQGRSARDRPGRD